MAQHYLWRLLAHQNSVSWTVILACHRWTDCLNWGSTDWYRAKTTSQDIWFGFDYFWLETLVLLCLSQSLQSTETPNLQVQLWVCLLSRFVPVPSWAANPYWASESQDFCFRASATNFGLAVFQSSTGLGHTYLQVLYTFLTEGPALQVSTYLRMNFSKLSLFLSTTRPAVWKSFLLQLLLSVKLKSFARSQIIYFVPPAHLQSYLLDY